MRFALWQWNRFGVAVLWQWCGSAMFDEVSIVAV